MEEIKEFEVCRRDFSTNRKAALIGLIISASLFVVAWLVCIILAKTMNGNVSEMFTYPAYIPGLVVIGVTFVLSILFVILLFIRKKGSLALTNKRLVIIIQRWKLFVGRIVFVKSCMLNQVLSFDLVHITKRGLFCIALNNAKEVLGTFVVDQEFYDKLVEQMTNK